MALIRVSVNSEQRLSLQLDDYQKVSLGITIASGESDGELQCSVTSNTDSNHRMLETVKLFNRDTVTISNKAESCEEACFPEVKKNQLEEVYKNSNTGIPCRTHLHVVVDKKDKHIVFGNDSTDTFFNYIWFSGKETNELSLGSVGKSGSEHWMKSFVSLEQPVVLLFLKNK